jgi:hypothetical protein
MSHVLQTLALAILELPPHRLKGVTHGGVRVLMGMPFGVLVLRDEVGARGGDLDTNLVDTPLMAVFVWKRDDHVTVNDAGVDLGQALRKLPDACA